MLRDRFLTLDPDGTVAEFRVHPTMRAAFVAELDADTRAPRLVLPPDAPPPAPEFRGFVGINGAAIVADESVAPGDIRAIRAQVT